MKQKCSFGKNCFLDQKYPKKRKKPTNTQLIATVISIKIVTHLQVIEDKAP